MAVQFNDLWIDQIGRRITIQLPSRVANNSIITNDGFDDNELALILACVEKIYNKHMEENK